MDNLNNADTAEHIVEETVAEPIEETVIETVSEEQPMPEQVLTSHDRRALKRSLKRDALRDSKRQHQSQYEADKKAYKEDLEQLRQKHTADKDEMADAKRALIRQREVDTMENRAPWVNAHCKEFAIRREVRHAKRAARAELRPQAKEEREQIRQERLVQDDLRYEARKKAGAEEAMALCERHKEWVDANAAVYQAGRELRAIKAEEKEQLKAAKDTKNGKADTTTADTACEGETDYQHARAVATYNKARARSERSTARERMKEANRAYRQENHAVKQAKANKDREERTAEKDAFADRKRALNRELQMRYVDIQKEYLDAHNEQHFIAKEVHARNKSARKAINAKLHDLRAEQREEKLEESDAYFAARIDFAKEYACKRGNDRVAAIDKAEQTYQELTASVPTKSE